MKLAQESIVLLQNNKSIAEVFWFMSNLVLYAMNFLRLGVLPLDPKYSVAVIGPNFNATSTMQGNYHVNNHMHVTK